MPDLSRRSFLGSAGAAALGGVAVGTDAAAQTAPRRAASTTDARPLFFDAQEARFIEAACARLIPTDAVGPGAIEAGVPAYIDRQLAGAWGAGDRLYRSGPWTAGTPTQGYQLPFTPAELFRTALRGIRNDLSRAGRAPFEKLPAAEQDAYLTALQDGRVELDGVPSKVFFDTLLATTIEGFFADPSYGGNRDMVGWKMIGFPGAHANYYHLVDKHNQPLARAPISLSEDAGGHVHVAPVPRPRSGR